MSQNVNELPGSVVWRTMSPNQKSIVRLGMIPIEIAAEMDKLGFGPKDAALALMACAKADGGMMV